MFRAFAITLFLVLVGCDEQPDHLCDRQFVTRSGTESLALNPVSLVTQGDEAEVTVFAPLSSCVSDVLRASAELYDATNAPVAISAINVAAQSGVVRSSVVFTPQTPGSYLLRVAFEPSLGARSQRVDVVARPSLDAGVIVTLPVPRSSCLEPVWPVSADSVACEREAAQVDVFSSDGGVQTFGGQRLAVANGALWSIAPSSSRLERRVFENGTLRLTHQADGFSARLTPAMHGRDFALRADTFDRLNLVTVTDGGLTKTTTRHQQRSAPAWFFYDDARVYLVSGVAFPECFGLPECDEAGGLIAVEPGVAWRFQLSLDAFQWPISTTATPTLSLELRVRASSPPQGPFERLPLWVEAPANANLDDAVLVNWATGGLSLSLWPYSRVLRVGGHFVALTEENEHSVRIVPLQPP